MPRYSKASISHVLTLFVFWLATVLAISSVSQAATGQILHRFTGGADGGPVYAGLILDDAGNLYGTTTGGGDPACSGGCGTVFKLTRGQNGVWAESVLYSFAGGIDGVGPSANLVFDSAGNLYGTTQLGGSSNCTEGCGTVFELSPRDGGWEETVLYRFAGGDDGAYPAASLTLDSAGNLYGTTFEGGIAGTIFELSPTPDATWTETVLYRFTGGLDGGSPLASLIFDRTGSIYGTAAAGGKYGAGVVFKVISTSIGDWTETVLHNFSGGADGATPFAGLTFDSGGDLYGTTYFGGDPTCIDGCGTAFVLEPLPGGAWKEKLLHAFRGGRDGIGPQCKLVFDSDRNLYGTTITGGSNSDCAGNGPTGCGTVFELSPTNGGWRETILHRSVGGRDGVYPQAGVVLDAAGNLYGTSAYGGGGDACKNDGCGVAFEIMPPSRTQHSGAIRP